MSAVPHKSKMYTAVGQGSMKQDPTVVVGDVCVLGISFHSRSLDNVRVLFVQNFACHFVRINIFWPKFVGHMNVATKIL